MKVEFRYTNGRSRMMREREASILQRLGRGTYLTREMRAEPVAVSPLDAMEVDELRDLAKERGIKVHHKAGAARIKKALSEAD